MVDSTNKDDVSPIEFDEILDEDEQAFAEANGEQKKFQ